MPTTDNQQTPIPQTQTGTNFQPANDFDFGNLSTPETAEQTQASPDFSLELSPSQEAENPQSTASTQGFDFSLDLPSAYEAPTQETPSEPAEITTAPAPQFQPAVEEMPVQNTENLTVSATNFSPVEEISVPNSMETLLHEESQPSESFLTAEQTSDAQTPQTETLVEETPVMKTPFADEEPMPSALDPFEAMKASLEAAPVEEVPAPEATSQQVEGNVNSDVSLVEIPVANQEIPTVETSLEPQTQTVENAESDVEIPQSVSLESMLQSPVINQEISNPEPQQTLTLDAPSLQMPPVAAVQEAPVPQMQNPAPQAQTETSEAAPMLSLDEMIAQPQAVETAPVQAPAPQPQMQAPVMENLATQAVNPLTAPIGYPPIQQVPAQKTASKAWIFAGVLFGILMLAAGAMVLIKYPDLFQTGSLAGLFAENKTPENQLAQTPSETPAIENSETEHGAALPEGEEPTEMPTEEESQSPSDFPLVEVEETESLSEEIQEVNLEEQVDSMIDETSETELDEDTIEKKQEKPDTKAEKPTASDSEDALGAVEDLLGPISVNDSLLQEISTYRQQVSQLAETAKAQGNKIALKLRARVVMQLERLEQDLENGGKMTISEWKAKKAELDQVLENANDA